MTANSRKSVFFIYKLEVLFIYFSEGTLRSYFVFLMPWTGGNFHTVHFLDTCRWLTWGKGVLFRFNYIIIYTTPLDWDIRVRRSGKPGEDWEIKRFQRLINHLHVRYRAFKTRDRLFPSCCLLGASKQQVPVKLHVAPVQVARDRIKMQLTTCSRRRRDEMREGLSKTPSHYCPCL